MKYKRIFTIVVDSLGVGAMPDATTYGDARSDTLGHIDTTMPSLQIKNLQQLGLANLHPLQNTSPHKQPKAYYTKMLEAGKGKDTMTGHWEMMGLYITAPFITFHENGFPKALIDQLEARTKRKIIGNKASSGTEILDELGEQQIASGALIVYTSADSVLQICGHEETMGLDELYRCCKIARDITMKEEWKVGRVIARPYIGKKKGAFIRTANRHDYAVKPYGKTVLNALQDHAFDVIGIGKIHDIFDGEGITKSYTSKSSVHGMQQTMQCLEEDFTGLCFVNLVDFDALWGHRRNPIGYGEELERFDALLHDFIQKMQPDDLCIICADHGNDPTYTGSDHTREMVPFIAYSPSMQGHGLLPLCASFANVGATIADNFGVPMPEGAIGESVLALLQ